MSISTDRIRADIEAIARFTETPGAGATRPTFSDAWRQARDYVIDQAKAADCVVRIDAFGNVHARPSNRTWENPAWLCGSHIDTVPNGGDYDGVTGIVVALEILRADTNAPVELIIFAEEEGPTFGLGMLGSRAWVGDLSADQFADTSAHARPPKLRNKFGQTYPEAGAPHGVEPAYFIRDRINPAHYRGFIEVHIEQGPTMWSKDQRVAIVRAIAGRKQFRGKLTGVANHAGSTPMTLRRDALAAAATLILQFEGLARGLSPEAVMTVGRIECEPNAINVIPSTVRLTLDFRAPDNAILAEGHKRIDELVRQVCLKRFVEANFGATEDQPAIAMNAELCATLTRAAAARIGSEVPITISGALHDSAIIAPHIPTAMVFVASKDGISHNPAEFSRIEDIALAAEIVYDVVRG
jgi:hydantoinase/carbamoylase family amidase